MKVNQTLKKIVDPGDDDVIIFDQGDEDEIIFNQGDDDIIIFDQGDDDVIIFDKIQNTEIMQSNKEKTSVSSVENLFWQETASQLLTAEEEYELAKAYKENNDMEARQKLIVHNLRLVKSIAKYIQEE